MKGGLAVMLELAAAVPEPAIDVTWVFYAGEEVSADHNGLRHLFAQRPDLVAGDAAVLGEPTGAALEVGCQGAMRPCGIARCPRPHGPPVDGSQRCTAPAGCLRPWTTVARQPMIDGCTYHEALQAVFVEGAWRATSCRTGPS